MFLHDLNQSVSYAVLFLPLPQIFNDTFSLAIFAESTQTLIRQEQQQKQAWQSRGVFLALIDLGDKEEHRQGPSRSSGLSLPVSFS